MGQDSSIELEQIGPVQVHHLQEFACLIGIPRSARWVNDYTITYLEIRTGL